MWIEKSNEEDLHAEAEWVLRNLVNYLNKHCKNVKAGARSKRWWTKEIVQNRNMLESNKRSRRRGEATQQQVKKQQSNLRRMIRQSKMKVW